jgi:transcription elongation factor Elf1
MGRRVVPLMEKTSRLAIQIEEYFRDHRHEELSLGQILDKYFHIGQSDETIAYELNRMMKGKVPVLRSTLGYAIRLVIKQGKTNFRFEAKKAGNPYRKPGSGFKHDKPDKHKKVKQVVEQQVHVKFKCKACDTTYQREMDLKNGLLNLMVHSCPKCGSFGESNATYSLDGATYYKTLIDSDIPGVQEEIFTGPDFKPVKEVVI